MSKLFIKTIAQYGGTYTDSQNKVVILNTASKFINKKMKILEYKHGIKLKLSELQTDNWDSIPKSVGMQTFVNIDGPYKGRIPIYTKTNINIPTPQITPITTAIPITPLGHMGPILGVPGLAVNPFGNSTTIDERIELAAKYLTIISDIDSQIEQFKNGDIEKSKLDKKYFDFVDLDEPDISDNLKDFLNISYNSGSYTKL
jgi:hypothetical protein